MLLPVLLAIIASLIFGVLAAVFSARVERNKHELTRGEQKLKYQLFELTLLRNMQEHPEANLDLEDDLQLIVTSMENILPTATVSYLIVNGETGQLRTYLKEAVGHTYLHDLEEKMHQSLQALGVSIPPLEKKLSGTFPSENTDSLPLSYFHIPMRVNDKICGVFTVSSVTKDAFSTDEMEVLYRVVHHTVSAVSRLKKSVTEENNKLIAMIKSLKDGAFMVNTQNEIIVCNNKTKELLGITKHVPTLLDIVNELPGGTRLVDKIEQSIMQKKAIEEHDVVVDNKYLELTITPVISGEKVIGAAVLFHDNTAEKSVAQMKEDFTNIMVHELRSPLTAIKASSQLIIAKDAELTTEERKKLLKMISDQSQKLLNEVALILDAAKLHAGLFTVQKTDGDLKKLITDQVEIFLPQAQGKYITLKTDIEDSLPNFFFDQRYMGLVLNNLLSNSLKFTNVGGTISLTAKKDNGGIFLSVSDNGIGIPKEKQGALFSKFTQIATPGAHVGTGLGLYIVKGIIEAHGGRIALDSEPGRGTTITMRIPLGSQSVSDLPLHPVLTDKPHQTYNYLHN